MARFFRTFSPRNQPNTILWILLFGGVAPPVIVIAAWKTLLGVGQT